MTEHHTQRGAEALPNGNFKVTVVPPDETALPGASVELSLADYNSYCAWINDGGPIQDFLPDLDDDTRQVLLSGLTPETYARLFGGGPE